ncbi:MAG: preprotein translocase subunit YajC [Treponema sp.]|nr:preprotein translocase subunit YajC [Treponema sp.]
MNDFFLFLLQTGNAADGGAPAGGSLWSSLFIFIPIIAIFYFLIIRPQNKKQKETQRMLSTLKKGDRVFTIGGIHGTIQSIRDQSVIVKVDDNTKIEFSRSAISGIDTTAREDKNENKDEDEAEIEAPADEKKK